MLAPVKTPLPRNESSVLERRDLALAYRLMAGDASHKYSVVTCKDPEIVWNTSNSTFQAASEASVDAKPPLFQHVKMKVFKKLYNIQIKFKILINELAVAGRIGSELEKKTVLLREL